MDIKRYATNAGLVVSSGPSAMFVKSERSIVQFLRAMDTHNRKKKSTNVSFLAEEMKAGRWLPTNQGIGVSESGRIIDGGHRLDAMYESGREDIVFLLVTGLSDDAQKYVDQHAKRSMADTLKLFLNQEVSHQLVATMNVIHASKQLGFRTPKRLSPDEIVDLMDEYSDDISMFSNIPQFWNLPSPVCAAILISFHDRKDEKIFDFATEVVTGEMIAKGDPSYALRNYIVASRGYSSGGSTVQKERFQKTRAAIMAHVKGRRLTKLYAVNE